VTVSNATLAATTINLGSSAGGVGLLTLQSNAVVTVGADLNVVSGSLGSTSIVSVTGGSLLVTNGTVRIGAVGNGQMTISDGTHTINQIKLGSTNGAGTGSLYLLGGYLTILSSISANFVIVDGIDIDGSGGTIIIGDSHDAEWDMVSGMSAGWATMQVGYSDGYTGTYVQSGGIMTVSNSLVVGQDCADGAGGALGQVTLSGGTLYVTNATHTAVLDVRNGTFIINPGATLVVDNLVVTNACGRFMNLGGAEALVQNNPPLLSPYLDADGDGMLNWQEAAAGTDPLNPASVFVITGVVQTNRSDIRVDWTTVGGHSYVVQTNSGASGATFHDLTGAISVGSSTEGTTNYVQVGAATNAARYYRVRLGP
jgi:ethanolamine utilization microcompartment shell protein EutS